MYVATAALGLPFPPPKKTHRNPGNPRNPRNPRNPKFPSVVGFPQNVMTVHLVWFLLPPTDFGPATGAAKVAQD